MDLTEWQIVTTSDKCPYLIHIYEYDDIGRQSIDCTSQCDYPENENRTCLKKLCPIKEEKNETKK